MPTASRECKEFTLNIKTDIPQKRPDGRNESVVVYEYGFDASEVMEWSSEPDAETAMTMEKQQDSDINYPWNEKMASSSSSSTSHSTSGLKMKTFKAEWKDFEATYRGRPVSGNEAKSLDPSQIKEISLMCRSNVSLKYGSP